MTFDERYRQRFDAVIRPAIESITAEGVRLSAKRVDASKSGDSILTEIVDGISHARMVLADVSTVGRDSATSAPYRNGNVMYEVGVALASRLPADVLLIRDDREKFLFDVSAIPHMTIDFTQTEQAKQLLQTELLQRLKEQNFAQDARVTIATAGLTDYEMTLLRELAVIGESESRGWGVGGTVLSRHEMAIGRLADKNLIRVTGRFKKGFPGYQLTALGRVVAKNVANAVGSYVNESDDHIGPPDASAPSDPSKS